jgi:hypothetical protein
MTKKSSRPEKKFGNSSTETTEKSTSARASRDYKVALPCLLTYSLCLHFFSVTSVVPQVRDEILLGWRATPRCVRAVSEGSVPSNLQVCSPIEDCSIASSDGGGMHHLLLEGVLGCFLFENLNTVNSRIL